MNIFVDYAPTKECKNKDVWYTCYKCGKCGRVFNDNGIMIDDGDTTVMDDEVLE